MMLYPWQMSSWHQLIAQRARLPHALLLTGEAGIGKRQFAEHLAQYLLCEAKDANQMPCGSCLACHWFKEGNHPDFRVLSLDEIVPIEELEGIARKRSGQWITVEAVRTLNDFTQVGAHRGGHRVVLVYPAEAMNLAGANAFLKMLEEPSEGVIFILVSHCWQRLLSTIKSRCRRFALPTPDEAQALHWLTLQKVEQPHIHLRHCGGAPLHAYQQAQMDQSGLLNIMLRHLSEPQKWNVGELAADIEKLKVETIDIIDCLQRWVVDWVLYQATGKAHYYPDCIAGLQSRGQLGARVWIFYDLLLQARQYALHPLNQRLLLEKIFYTWIEVLKEAHQHNPVAYS
jgi:DNA polymerase-3 subunit delta'